MDKKGLGFLLLAVLLIVSAMVFLPAVQDTAQAQQAPIEGDVKGWMWSNNIGWISLDSNETEPVKVVANQFQGYGWSESIGWINFAPIGPYPGAPNNSVKINADNYEGEKYPLLGWARACSVFVSGCGEDAQHNTLKSSAELGGWDGWIKMVNATYDPAENHFEGFAWGYTNLGWTGFSSEILVDPDTCTSDCCNPPCIIDGGETFSVTCSASPNNPKVNELVTFTANVSKAGTYSYSWFGQTNNDDGDTFSFTTSYDKPDTYNVTVKVENTDNVIKEADCKTSTGDVIVSCDDGETWNEEEARCIPDVVPCQLSIGDTPADIVLDFDSRTQTETSQTNLSASLTPVSCTGSLDLVIENPLDGVVDILCYANSAWSPCNGLTSDFLIGAQGVAENIDNNLLDDFGCVEITINSLDRYLCFSGAIND
jgi:hypothetical protein